jgi:hypothetical protein
MALGLDFQLRKFHFPANCLADQLHLFNRRPRTRPMSCSRIIGAVAVWAVSQLNDDVVLGGFGLSQFCQ